MIDTDKYEGHTEGEWTVDIDSYDKYGSIRPVEISRHERGQKGWTLIATIRHRKPLHALEYEKANAQLIADAPLLLAEVKRLREQYTELREALVGDSPNWTHEELVERALVMREPAELEFGEWHTDMGEEE